MMTVFKCAKINLDSSSPSALCARDNGKNLFTGPLVLSAANYSDIIISLFSPICEMKEKKLVCHRTMGILCGCCENILWQNGNSREQKSGHFSSQHDKTYYTNERIKRFRARTESVCLASSLYTWIIEKRITHTRLVKINRRCWNANHALRKHCALR